MRITYPHRHRSPAHARPAMQFQPGLTWQTHDPNPPIALEDGTLPFGDIAVLDGLWRPGSAGNGRILITGTARRVGGSVRWRVNGGAWQAGAGPFAANGDRFFFYVTGPDPGPPTGAVEPAWSTVVAQPYYQAPAATKPKFVIRQGAVLVEAASLPAVATTADTWFWQSGVLYLQAPGGGEPLGVVLSYDTAFKQGSAYTIEIQAVATFSFNVAPNQVRNETANVALSSESFTWQFEVRDIVGEWRMFLRPTWLADSEVVDAIEFAWAKQIADLYTLLDDVALQTDPTKTTWAIGIWEELLGLPNGSALTLQQRRDAINARRARQDGTREDFFAAITPIIGTPAVTDGYAARRIDIRLPSIDTTKRALIEALIDQIKPVGIQVVVSYSSFLAGLSKAGDPI